MKRINMCTHQKKKKVSRARPCTALFLKGEKEDNYMLYKCIYIYIGRHTYTHTIRLVCYYYYIYI
jgi:hypothetical protein